MQEQNRIETNTRFQIVPDEFAGTQKVYFLVYGPGMESVNIGVQDVVIFLRTHERMIVNKKHTRGYAQPGLGRSIPYYFGSCEVKSAVNMLNSEIKNLKEDSDLATLAENQTASHVCVICRG